MVTAQILKVKLGDIIVKQQIKPLLTLLDSFVFCVLLSDSNERSSRWTKHLVPCPFVGRAKASGPWLQRGSTLATVSIGEVNQMVDVSLPPFIWLMNSLIIFFYINTVTFNFTGYSNRELHLQLLWSHNFIYLDCECIRIRNKWGIESLHIPRLPPNVVPQILWLK